MDLQLLILSGPEKNRVIKLSDVTKVTLGRGQSCDVIINDPRSSRMHCELIYNDTELRIVDLGSSGGTFVNGKRIAESRLKRGDKLQIGDSLIELQSAGTQSAGDGQEPRALVARLSVNSLNALVGKTIDQFLLTKILHAGANSVLFLANDLRQERFAVVKVMQPTLMSDDEQRSRFVRAVHTMINVKHDNLVEIYGAGKSGNLCWCAMEFVDGISILEMIELIGVNGRLDWREVYRIAVHIGRALECAETHKIVHRNVALENLLQRKNDKVVKLCDLLLAKAFEGSQARQITVPGQIVGNLGYMAPERLVDTSQLDWRSDQYGLGATLFALLTGHPPFEAKTLPELIKAIRSETPRFPTEVTQEGNATFLKIVLKMLNKEPKERFAFPNELLRRLDELGKQANVDADLPFNL